MIIVMGLPGAGKSTVLAAAEGKGYKMLNFGSEMWKLAQKTHSHLSHRDEIRTKLNPDQQKELQQQVFELLAKEDGKVILDTHCTIKTPTEYLRGLPHHLLKLLKVEYLVLISAKLEDIVRRRNSDPSRVRDPESIESLREHDRQNWDALRQYVELTGAPAMIIMNNDNGLDRAQAQLVSLLK